MNPYDVFEWLRQNLKIPKTTELVWLKSDIYKKRLEQVKSGWILAGLLMLASDNNAAVMGIALFSIFLSFAFLEKDESTFP
jgi:hypothetical protein